MIFITHYIMNNNIRKDHQVVSGEKKYLSLNNLSSAILCNDIIACFILTCSIKGAELPTPKYQNCFKPRTMCDFCTPREFILLWKSRGGVKGTCRQGSVNPALVAWFVRALFSHSFEEYTLFERWINPALGMVYWSSEYENIPAIPIARHRGL